MDPNTLKTVNLTCTCGSKCPCTANFLSAVSADLICVPNPPSVGCEFSRYSSAVYYRKYV